MEPAEGGCYQERLAQVKRIPSQHSLLSLVHEKDEVRRRIWNNQSGDHVVVLSS